MFQDFFPEQGKRSGRPAGIKKYMISGAGKSKGACPSDAAGSSGDQNIFFLHNYLSVIINDTVSCSAAVSGPLAAVLPISAEETHFMSNISWIPVGRNEKIGKGYIVFP